MNRVLCTFLAFILFSAGSALAGKKKAAPPVLLAASAEGTRIFDTLDPDTAGYPAWRALSSAGPLCDRRGVERMFGPALQRMLEEREKQNAGKPATFGVPSFQAPQGLLQKYVRRHCRLGPGTVTAHGPGWVKTVALKEFKADLSPTILGQGAFLSIWAVTDLKNRPLFYTTLPAPKQNHYQSATAIELEQDALTPKDRQRILNALPKQDPSDQAGSIKIYRYGKKGLLARVEREGTRGTNPKYHASWFDYLVLSGGKVQVVFRGDSDFTRESAHMELTGVLDLDGDGHLEVLLRGAQCIVLARHTKKGFQPFRLSSLF